MKIIYIFLFFALLPLLVSCNSRTDNSNSTSKSAPSIDYKIVQSRTAVKYIVVPPKSTSTEIGNIADYICENNPHSTGICVYEFFGNDSDANNAPPDLSDANDKVMKTIIARYFSRKSRNIREFTFCKTTSCY